MLWLFLFLLFIAKDEEVAEAIASVAMPLEKKNAYFAFNSDQKLHFDLVLTQLTRHGGTKRVETKFPRTRNNSGKSSQNSSDRAEPNNKKATYLSNIDV